VANNRTDTHPGEPRPREGKEHKAVLEQRTGRKWDRQRLVIERQQAHESEAKAPKRLTRKAEAKRAKRIKVTERAEATAAQG
jgi:hypothetical protein